jgi:DinB superfamily
MPPVLGPQLENVKHQLLDARERAHRVCEPLSPAQWATRPGEGQWSVGEALAHLNITSERYLPLIETAIRDGGHPHGEEPFRAGLMGKLLVWVLEPPYRMKVKTGPEFVPGDAGERGDVLDHFDVLQGNLLALLDDTAGLALEKLIVASPFSRRVKYNLYATFLIVAAHQRRHLWQAEQTVTRLSAGAPPAQGHR